MYFRSVRETIDFAARVQGTGVRVQELQRVKFAFLHEVYISHMLFWTSFELRLLSPRHWLSEPVIYSASMSRTSGAGHHGSAGRGVWDAEGGQEWQRRGAI